MSAARKQPVTLPDLPAAVDGVTLARCLKQTLARFVGDDADRVMREAGWDPRGDAPVDQRLEPVRWLDARLFPHLAETIGLLRTDEARRDLDARLRGRTPPLAALPTSDVGAAAPPTASAAGSGATARSGIRARRRSATFPTYAPPATAALLVVWSERDDLDALADAIGPDASIVRVRDADELAATLVALDATVSMVVLDRRGRRGDELRHVGADDLMGHQVLVWGVASLDTPELDRMLCDTERRIGVAAEADARDVGGLCAALLGATRTPSAERE